MARRTIQGSRTLITGASSGIGRELAMELARSGARLVLIARRQEQLAEVAGQIGALGLETPRWVAGDISDPQVRAAALAEAQATFGGLDVLINNAGIGALGRFADAAPERLRRIMEVNFFAAAELIRTAIPLLRQGKQPMIVNVGSILGHRAVPRSSEYCASKFALHGLTESLRAELAGLGIDVLLVAPGTTATEFDAHRIENQGGKPWPSQPGVSPAYVARATVKAIRRGRKEIIPNPRGRMLCWLNRLSPRLVDRLMARYG